MPTFRFLIVHILSLGSYLVTVEVGSPCGDKRLTNLFVNELAFIDNEILHAGQYTKVGETLPLSPFPLLRMFLRPWDG